MGKIRKKVVTEGLVKSKEFPIGRNRLKQTINIVESRSQARAPTKEAALSGKKEKEKSSVDPRLGFSPINSFSYFSH